jgi:hypothetical protein
MDSHTFTRAQQSYQMPTQSKYNLQQEMKEAESMEVVSSMSQFPEGCFVAEQGLGTDGKKIYVCPGAVKTYLDLKRSSVGQAAKDDGSSQAMVFAGVILLLLILLMTRR